VSAVRAGVGGDRGEVRHGVGVKVSGWVKGMAMGMGSSQGWGSGWLRLLRRRWHLPLRFMTSLQARQQDAVSISFLH
jgi:hypothetical protein